MDNLNISSIVLPVVLAVAFILLPILQYYTRPILKKIHPVTHAVIFCVCLSGFLFCLAYILFILFVKQDIDYKLGALICLGVGIICFVVLIKTGIYKKWSNAEIEEYINTKSQTKQKKPLILEPLSNKLRDSLISARERAEALLEIGIDADTANVRLAIERAYHRYDIAVKYLKQEHRSNPEYMPLRDLLRTGQARLNTLLRDDRKLSSVKSKLDDNSREIISNIHNVLSGNVRAGYETKTLDWVTCDKCGFIGVRNIKTRELEEMEDNQRRTGQPILIRINSLGDIEPRHEKIPECIMQAQDFSIIPPLSSHSLPLFYMQLRQHCPQFTEWQKGSSPKEHREIRDRQLRQQSTAHKEDSQSLGYGIQPIITARDKQKATNSQIQDVEMGKHRTRIVELLNIWKEQLSLMIKRTELEDFVANIESDNEFRAILRHCPSVNRKYNELGLARAVCEAKLNPISVVNGEEIKRRASKQEVAKDKRWLNEKMQSVVKAIEDSLKSNEYTRTRCGWCPQDMR